MPALPDDAPAAASADSGKKRRGQYFTTTSPFGLPAFAAWAAQFDPEETVLEPFAGSNGLIPMLREQGLAPSYASFDIEPAESTVRMRDTIADFPRGYSVCVTNPPYLAKNSATRSGLALPPMEGYDNLWKLSVSRCLAHCDFVAAIIPGSFLTSGLFQDRLQAVVSLNFEMFDDTEQPVCLALWGPHHTSGVFDVWQAGKRLGSSTALRRRVDGLLPAPRQPVDIQFNVLDGQIGIRGVDGLTGPSIRFVPAFDIPAAKVKESARFLTRIKIDSPHDPELIIAEANVLLARYRMLTADVFLTSFRGIRKDRQFRRRLDWASARRILEVAVNNIAPMP